MKQEQDTTHLTEQRIVRRGLIAGIAGLAAAGLLKATGGAKRLEAAATAILMPAAPGDAATFNTSYNNTTLKGGTNSAGAAIFIADANEVTAPQSVDGVRAFAHGPSGWGLWSSGGASNTGSAYGVYTFGGPATAGTANGSPAVYATGGNGVGGGRGGAGVVGSGGGSSGGPLSYGIGVQGLSQNYKGVYGESTSGDGVHGHSVQGVGLRGTSQGNVGLVGISDTSIGLYGYNQIAGTPAFYAENLAPSGNRIAGYFNGHVQVQGNFTVLPGYAKNAAVTMPDGTDAVLYCQESPEPYFEDFGRAQLNNGHARVQLEPEFASIVKRDDYMVYLTPEGESKGWLFIAGKNANGFEVREANGGRSDIPFTYRIVARRKDIAGKRLERLDPKTKQTLSTMRAQSKQKASLAPQALSASTIDTPLVANEPVPARLPEPPKKER